MKMIYAILVAILLAVAPLCDSAHADDSDAIRGAGPKKQIQFDDNVVEGMKNGKDSLETIGKKDGLGKQHLYKKRPEYKRELGNINHEMGATP